MCWRYDMTYDMWKSDILSMNICLYICLLYIDVIIGQPLYRRSLLWFSKNNHVQYMHLLAYNHTAMLQLFTFSNITILHLSSRIQHPISTLIPQENNPWTSLKKLTAAKGRLAVFASSPSVCANFCASAKSFRLRHLMGRWAKVADGL